MIKFIRWLGSRNYMRWFRKLYYKFTDHPLWGIQQLMADHPRIKDYGEESGEFDRERFTKDINEFMKQYE